MRLSTRSRCVLLFLSLAGGLGAHSLEKECTEAYEAGKKDLSQGLEMTKQVLQQARARRDVAAEAAALVLLGGQQRSAGARAAALASGRDAVRLARAANDNQVLARALSELGRTTYEEFLLEESAECFQEASVVAERLQDLNAACNAHTGLGRIYHRLGDPARERLHRTRALECAEKQQDALQIAVCSGNLAETLIRAGELARARELLETAQRLHRQRASKLLLHSNLDSLAQLEMAERRFDSALTLLEPAVAYFREKQNPEGKLCLVLLHRAQALRALGRLDEALAAALEAARLAAADSDLNRRDQTQQELANLQAARGDFAAAFAAERQAREARERFYSEQTQRRVTGLQSRYDLEFQRNTIDRLDRESRLQTSQLRLREVELLRARRERLAVASAALLGVAALAVILILQRQRLRAEREARAQSEAARAAADEASRLKTRLLNFASHDLKAPLASLGLAAREIEGVADNPAEVRQLAGLVRAEATEMSRLVHDFLDHSTIEAGRLELKPVPLDLGEVAARVAAEVRPLAAAKQQVLAVLASAAPLPLVLGESPRLGQVFGNLLSNAIKFTPPGGRIEVATGHDATGVWCEVRDSGPGIAAADLARLFQPFAKLSAKPTGGETSTGLGLSLACELVTLHGGVLQVDSQPGRGAVFRVVLAPAEDVRTDDAGSPSAPASAGR